MIRTVFRISQSVFRPWKKPEQKFKPLFREKIIRNTGDSNENPGYYGQSGERQYLLCSRADSGGDAVGPVEFEYLWLSEWNLVPFRRCFTCFVKGEAHCPIKDKAPEIEQKMLASDGVIFATPVYGMNVSGLFKTFVDRLAYIFHCPRFFDQKALLLTTTGALGIKNVLD
jgi:multimeric flavodoxin WrbA